MGLWRQARFPISGVYRDIYLLVGIDVDYRSLLIICKTLVILSVNMNVPVQQITRLKQLHQRKEDLKASVWQILLVMNSEGG